MTSYNPIFLLQDQSVELNLSQKHQLRIHHQLMRKFLKGNPKCRMILKKHLLNMIQISALTWQQRIDKVLQKIKRDASKLNPRSFEISIPPFLSTEAFPSCIRQAGRIAWNLGTMFQGNLDVSEEILIVNPTHLSRKCDTPKTTQTS